MFFRRLNPTRWFTRSLDVVATMLPDWQRNQPVYELLDYETYVRDGYAKNEVIYAALQAWSNTASAVTLRVYRQGMDRGADAELRDHPLRDLLEQPNEEMSESDFMSLTCIMLKLSGRAYWEKQRNHAGEVIGLWPLRPDLTEIIGDEKRFIKEYRYKVPGRAEPLILARDDVLSFRYFDPRDIRKCIAPLSVAGRTGDVDNAATDFIKLFWERGAMPLGGLKFKGKLTDTQVKDIRKRWADRHGGYYKWFEPAVLDQDVEFQRYAFSMQEMDFSNLDERNEARICMALQVPPILIGTLLGLRRSTYSNYEQARLAWSQDFVLPYYQYIARRITIQMRQDFDEADVYVHADTSGLPAFQENEDAQFARGLNGWNSGLLTLNQALETAGYPKIGLAGDIYKHSYGDLIVDVQGNPSGVPAPSAPQLPKGVVITEADVKAAKQALLETYGIRTGANGQ